MIGKKCLRDVRSGLLDECAKAGVVSARWFDERIGKLEHSASRNTREIETLKLILDGLRTTPSGSK